MVETEQVPAEVETEQALAEVDMLLRVVEVDKLMAFEVGRIRVVACFQEMTEVRMNEQWSVDGYCSDHY